MKVLLVKDVYKLGRAGDVKRVASGFGRNYLIPQGLAVLATPGAINQADYIREKASVQRAVLNEEMGSVAEQLLKLSLAFPAKAGETGKLYGSITSQDVTDEIEKLSGIIIKKQQVDMHPLRSLGEHKIQIRLTMDLIPELKVQVYREGEDIPDPDAEVKEKATTEVAETKQESDIVEETSEAEGMNEVIEESPLVEDEIGEVEVESTEMADNTKVEETTESDDEKKTEE